MLLAPIPAGAVAARRDRAPSIGLVANLAAIVVVAAATIGVFFGIAFALLQPPANPAVPQVPIRERSAGAVAAVPRRILAVSAAMAAGPAGVPKLAGEASASPRARAAPLPTLRISGPGPNTVSAAKPVGQPSRSLPAVANLPERQLAGLVARGDAFFRAGDIASAQLFYERAAEGGDGQAALRAGATFDPTFLASIGLRRMHGDRTKALFWYRRAIGLGAGNAEPYLNSLETK